jgi:hypothetical protein
MHTGGAATTVDGHAFTITGHLPDTSLHGQLITVDDVTLTTGPVIWNMPNPDYKKQQRKPPTKGIKDVRIETEEAPERIDQPWGSETTLRAVCRGPSVDYFFIMTIQKGPPPKFEVQGQGLQARVKVGNRTVRFAQERLIIE